MHTTGINEFVEWPKKHSANHLTLGKEPDSGGGRFNVAYFISYI
jgi:hypothetical protein